MIIVLWVVILVALLNNKIHQENAFWLYLWSMIAGVIESYFWFMLLAH